METLKNILAAIMLLCVLAIVVAAYHYTIHSNWPIEVVISICSALTLGVCYGLIKIIDRV